MELRDLVLVDGVRTPMAEYNGSFADISAIDLGAHAARALFERTGIDPAEIDHTVVGNALQTSPDAIYGARFAPGRYELVTASKDRSAEVWTLTQPIYLNTGEVMNHAESAVVEIGQPTA